MAKEKILPQYKNMRALVFNEELGSFNSEKVVQIAGDRLETENDLLPIDCSKKYVDESDGKLYYVFNVDLPAKVESGSLKNLRRSTALQRIFDYDKQKPFDILSIFPWVIIIALIVFK